MSNEQAKTTDIVMQAAIDVASQQASRRGPTFVRVPQHLLDFVNRPLKTLSDVVLLAEDVGKQSSLIYAYEGQRAPRASFGAITYRVEEDGALTVHESSIDTSD